MRNAKQINFPVTCEVLGVFTIIRRKVSWRTINMFVVLYLMLYKNTHGKKEKIRDASKNVHYIFYSG